MCDSGSMCARCSGTAETDCDACISGNDRYIVTTRAIAADTVGVGTVCRGKTVFVNLLQFDLTGTQTHRWRLTFRCSILALHSTLMYKQELVLHLCTPIMRIGK